MLFARKLQESRLNLEKKATQQSYFQKKKQKINFFFFLSVGETKTDPT